MAGRTETRAWPGGFYDHVTPPSEGVPDPAQVSDVTTMTNMMTMISQSS
jgi:hypothetical protein